MGVLILDVNSNYCNPAREGLSLKWTRVDSWVVMRIASRLSDNSIYMRPENVYSENMRTVR